MTNSPLLYILCLWPDTPITTTPSKSSRISNVFMTSFVILNITHWEYFIGLIKEFTSRPTHRNTQSLHTAPNLKMPLASRSLCTLPKPGVGVEQLHMPVLRSKRPQVSHLLVNFVCFTASGLFLSGDPFWISPVEVATKFTWESSLPHPIEVHEDLQG